MEQRDNKRHGNRQAYGPRHGCATPDGVATYALTGLEDSRHEPREKSMIQGCIHRSKAAQEASGVMPVAASRAACQVCPPES